MCLTHLTMVKRKEPPSQPLDLRSFQPMETRLSFTRIHPIQVSFLHTRPSPHSGPASTGRRLAFYEFKLWKGILILSPLLVPGQIFSQTTNCEPSPSQTTLRSHQHPSSLASHPPVFHTFFPSTASHILSGSRFKNLRQFKVRKAKASCFCLSPSSEQHHSSDTTCSWYTIQISQPSPSLKNSHFRPTYSILKLQLTVDSANSCQDGPW